jgi:hypothetical protein
VLVSQVSVVMMNGSVGFSGGPSGDDEDDDDERGCDDSFSSTATGTGTASNVGLVQYCTVPVQCTAAV